MLGSRVKQIRKSQKITQNDLAERLEITQQEVSLIERNKRKRFSVDEIELLATALGVSVADLLDDAQPTGTNG